MFNNITTPFKGMRWCAKRIGETRIGKFFRTIKGRFVLSGIWMIIALLAYVNISFLQNIPLFDNVIIEFLSVLFTLLVLEYYKDKQQEEKEAEAKRQQEEKEAEAKRQQEEKEAEVKKQQEEKEAEALETYKKGLVRQARSRNNNNALDAIDIIREEGWLDGTTDNINLLKGINLENADLSNANLSNGQLGGTKFTGKSKLNGTDFSDAMLKNAIFIGAELKKTIFTGANLIGCDFTHANLIGCIFQANEDGEKKESSLVENNKGKEVTFYNARLEGEIIKDENGTEKKTYLNFKGMRLNGTCFKNAQLSFVCFDDTWLEECDFTRAKFIDVVFSNAHLKNSILRCKQMQAISFQSADLTNAKLQYTSFIGVIFTSAILKDAQCEGASFSSSNITITDFSSADLDNMIVRDAIFENVKFNGKSTFFDGKLLELHWISILENYWLATQKENENTADNPGIAIEKFEEIIKQIVKSFGLKSFVVSIDLGVYKKQKCDEGDSDDEDSEPKFNLSIIPDGKFSVDITYYSELKDINLAKSIQIEEDDYESNDG